MIIQSIEGGYDKNFAYVIGCEKSRTGAVIDAAVGAETILKTADQANLKLKYLIITHSHHDHYAWAEALLKKLRGVTLITYGENIRDIGESKHLSVEDGDTVYMGGVELTFHHTPGHYPDCICIQAEDALFTGDTLFIGRTGRVKSPKSNLEDLYTSLKDKVLTLPGELTVYPGHNYGPQPYRTLQEEKAQNRFLQAESLKEFTAVMDDFERTKQTVS